MRYRRARIKGGTYFFTVVSHKRQKIFAADKNIEILRAGFQHVMRTHPFRIDAHVILPGADADNLKLSDFVALNQTYTSTQRTSINISDSKEKRL